MSQTKSLNQFLCFGSKIFFLFNANENRACVSENRNQLSQKLILFVLKRSLLVFPATFNLVTVHGAWCMVQKKLIQNTEKKRKQNARGSHTKKRERNRNKNAETQNQHRKKHGRTIRGDHQKTRQSSRRRLTQVRWLSVCKHSKITKKKKNEKKTDSNECVQRKEGRKRKEETITIPIATGAGTIQNGGQERKYTETKSKNEIA